MDVDGVDVPLVPVDVAYYWHQRREARFVDARGEQSYDLSHILGAVLSPAPDGTDPDPVASWPTDDTIVCYCGCPHHLSGLRAADLLENRYDNVFAIDEGYWEWQKREYPTTGRAVGTEPPVSEISGRTDPDDAGETAWAWHESSGQREATSINANGWYTLELRFTGVTSESQILVETPTYRVHAPLGRLRNSPITEQMATPADIGETRGH